MSCHEYKYLYSKMLDKELIKKAFFKMRKGKTKRGEIVKISNNLDHYVDYMYDMLLNTIPNAEHPERGFMPPKHKPVYIFEHGKERVIYIPSIIEQWVHHIIMQVLSPILLKKFHPNSYGSIPNKGLHKGKKMVVRYRYNYRYVYKLDIRHFFASIRLPILIKKLREFIKDEWFIHLIEVCFTWHQKGLPLGFYLSQWLSNLMLNDLDWLIVEHGIHYVRYVDDIVMFGNNKRKLRKCFVDIKKCLGENRLTAKNNDKLYRSKEPLSFLGFIFTKSQIRLRKNIARNIVKISKRINKATENKQPIWTKDARSLLSLMGWVRHSDSYIFYFYNIKPYVSIKKLKRIISKTERRDRDDSLDCRGIRPSPARA